MSAEQMLKAKKERFCLEYVIDYNGAAAARRSGYAKKTAKKTACLLLKEESVLHRIRQLQQGQRERLCVTQELVLIKLAELLDMCMAKRKPIRVWNAEDGTWDEQGSYAVDTAGACRCLELLGRHLGMFSDKAVGQSDTAPVFYEGEQEIPE